MIENKGKKFFFCVFFFNVNYKKLCLVFLSLIKRRILIIRPIECFQFKLNCISLALKCVIRTHYIER